MGFIIGDEHACNQCGRVTYSDGSPVTWPCASCGKLVCRFCCLTDHYDPREILEVTLCSTKCAKIYVVESDMKGAYVEPDVRRAAR